MTTANPKRNQRLLQTFGITEDQWNQMYERQKGECPICSRMIYKPGNPWGKRAAPVDHDHVTGRVRGLTCVDCNRFKIAKNTIDSATRLVTYLRSSFDGRNL